MLDRFKRAMNYWMFAVSHPGYVLEFAQKDLHRVRISFYIIFMFSMFYTFTSYLLWTRARIPFLETWIPYFPSAEHYFYQMFMTFPWMIIAWLSVAGFIYLFTALSGKEAFFEDALMISALCISIPYLMFWWIPETFLIPAMGSGSHFTWPDLFEYERKYLFPGIWQTALIAFGMRKVNNTNKLVCIIAGVVSVLIFFCIYLPFIR